MINLARSTIRAGGATAVIDSSREDLPARLRELRGEGAPATGRPRAGTDIYLDAAGAAAVVDSALANAKHDAVLGIVGVHKNPGAGRFRRDPRGRGDDHDGDGLPRRVLRCRRRGVAAEPFATITPA